MNGMSIRQELRTYSKGDLTRIAVVATQKQAAAEQALRGATVARWRLTVLAFLIGVAIGAGAGQLFGWGG
jgi:hypothetical protein